MCQLKVFLYGEKMVDQTEAHEVETMTLQIPNESGLERYKPFCAQTPLIHVIYVIVLLHILTEDHLEELLNKNHPIFVLDMCDAKALGYYWNHGKKDSSIIINKYWHNSSIVWHLLKPLLFYSGDTSELLDANEKIETKQEQLADTLESS